MQAGAFVVLDAPVMGQRIKTFTGAFCQPHHCNLHLAKDARTIAPIPGSARDPRN
ncbi:hypothetical protein RAZWK3B_19136 [Roseobacter sp. AzwK-3b]|uniref:hypothetical protein n=1 Tax=Roseobacter sp. AzwK-3b TaxID=351016 RepID=UPI0001569D26|nr:hypothetical protein [Roseobacter sp. AzwK-3b]EDM71498.1 hypothetical protein RAZWK3B_19136 [Roseobacter sp. AzwK-3b]